MEKVIQVCDVCETVGKSVEPYLVENDGREGTAVLCVDDATPFERVLGAKKRLIRRAPATTPARPRIGATTIEEIERRKNAEKTPA